MTRCKWSSQRIGGDGVKRKLPSLAAIDYQDVHEFVVAFFVALGWDPIQQEIDPSKIRVHPDNWKRLCEDIKEVWGLGGALAWMNYGPSGDEDNRVHLQIGEVEIIPGAMDDVV